MIHLNFLQLNVREPDDVGACGNITLGVGCITLLQCSRLFAFLVWIVQIVIQACDIYVVIKTILSAWSIENPRWRPFSMMATNKCIWLHQAGPNWPNSSIFLVKTITVPGNLWRTSDYTNMWHPKQIIMIYIYIICVRYHPSFWYHRWDE